MKESLRLSECNQRWVLIWREKGETFMVNQFLPKNNKIFFGIGSLWDSGFFFEEEQDQRKIGEKNCASLLPGKKNVMFKKMVSFFLFNHICQPKISVV